MSKWSHLPNARHIDWVISDFKENLDDWIAYWDTPLYAGRVVAVDAARVAAHDIVRANDRFTACEANWRATFRETLGLANDRACRHTAGAAGLALIAYDHAGKLFDMPVEQVRVLAYLGQPAAVLMLPACLVREKRRELIHE